MPSARWLPIRCTPLRRVLVAAVESPRGVKFVRSRIAAIVGPKAIESPIAHVVVFEDSAAVYSLVLHIVRPRSYTCMPALSLQEPATCTPTCGSTLAEQWLLPLAWCCLLVGCQQIWFPRFSAIASYGTVVLISSGTSMAIVQDGVFISITARSNVCYL